MRPPAKLADLVLDYPSQVIGQSRIVHADCLEWLERLPEASLHAVVTDPPYGIKEYEVAELEKRGAGRGGIWRIPPAFDGHTRAPLPRFTALNAKERDRLHEFFLTWTRLLVRVLRPGAHVMVATNAFVAPLMYTALIQGGLEFRGQVIRMVRTLRGGDRPKAAEDEFPGVCSLPRGCFEPWGVLRKPIPDKMRVADCLRAYQTGGLRRYADDSPFCDVIESGRTPRNERAIAGHPSLKPQALLRRLVYASLPLGIGVIADPFMGSGSTVAAAEAVKVSCLGVERHAEYYNMAKGAVPALAEVRVPGIETLVAAKKIER